MKETETIGRIDHPSGRSYKILELLNTETGVISLEGEQLQPFSSDIIKAIKSGYALKDCADDMLRGTWRRLAEKNAVRQSDISGDKAGDNTQAIVPESPPQDYPEAKDVAPIAGCQPHTGEDVPVSIHANCRVQSSDEANLEDVTVTLLPNKAHHLEGGGFNPEISDVTTVAAEVTQTVVTSHLRDRRSPESPASESMRLQIAARDRESDRLQSGFAGKEVNTETKTETADTVVIGVVDQITAQPSLEAKTVKVENVKIADPEPLTAKTENPDPFALF